MIAGNETITKSEFLNKHELARKIGMSVKFIEKWTHKGKIPGMTKFGNEWRYRLSDVERRLNKGSFLIE